MKKDYQEIEIMVVTFLQDDVVRTSSAFNNAFDDLAQWDSAWDGWFE